MIFVCKLCFEIAPKTILNGISGEFRAGELTAIMGASGTGKSTLLDLLTGYTNFASGTITVNGHPRDLKQFRRQVAYIMQDDLLQMHITAWEAMFFSVNLKIGPQLKRAEKKQRVRHATIKTGYLTEYPIVNMNFHFYTDSGNS